MRHTVKWCDVDIVIKKASLFAVWRCFRLSVSCTFLIDFWQPPCSVISEDGVVTLWPPFHIVMPTKVSRCFVMNLSCLLTSKKCTVYVISSMIRFERRDKCDVNLSILTNCDSNLPNKKHKNSLYSVNIRFTVKSQRSFVSFATHSANLILCEYNRLTFTSETEHQSVKHASGESCRIFLYNTKNNEISVRSETTAF